MANKTLAELAELVGGEVKGDENCIITGISTLSSAKKGQITFLDNSKYQQYLSVTSASAVILNQKRSENCVTNAIIVDNAYLAYAQIAETFRPASDALVGIAESAVVANSAEINSTASIGAHCVIGANVIIGAGVILSPGVTIAADCRVGENTFIGSNVSLYSKVNVGQNCRIHSGAVLGADGFGLAPHNGQWLRVPQLGGVTIGDDVDIGANSAIDRGALENTIINDGVKIDNLVQIAHNVQVGEHTAIAGCVVIAGSTKIGKHCMIGGASTIDSHIVIADKVVITGTTSVSHSIRLPGIYSSGMSAKPNKQWRKNHARFHRLDELCHKLKQLEKTVKDLQLQQEHQSE